jgi:protein-L-isoaspartate(D-aspartate) O-methyltransferase
VIALESDEALAGTARANLSRLEAGNATIVVGPPEQGWPSQAPYDVILIDGMVAELPDRLTEQLAERGRLVTIEAGKGRCGTAMLYLRSAGSVSGRPLFDASAPLLAGFEAKPVFAL